MSKRDLIDRARMMLGELPKAGADFNPFSDSEERLYETVRLGLLSEHDWSFARKRMIPQQTISVFTTDYLVPADCIALRRVFDGNQRNLDFIFAGDVIQFDSPPEHPILEYTSDCQDASRFHPKFQNALCAGLAAELVLLYQGKEKLRQMFQQEYQFHLADARTHDVNLNPKGR